MSLTSKLYALQTDYASATKSHPFLVSAAQNSLSPTLLSLWLSQDKIYAAHAYPRFIGRLIASIPFTFSNAASVVNENEKNAKLLKFLTASLQNIEREIAFFDSQARTWELDVVNWKIRKGTMDYVAEMDKIALEGSLLDGLVFLWAMERVYLDAWSGIHASLQAVGAPDSALHRFAQNWSSLEFVQFVDDLAQLVDVLALTSDCAQAEAIWCRVIELEVDFWPNQGEELSMRT